MSETTTKRIVHCAVCHPSGDPFKVPTDRGKVKVTCLAGHEFIFDPAGFQLVKDGNQFLFSDEQEIDEAILENSILHGRDHWGKHCKIEGTANPQTPAKLWALAKLHGLTPSGYKPTRAAKQFLQALRQQRGITALQSWRLSNQITPPQPPPPIPLDPVTEKMIIEGVRAGQYIDFSETTGDAEHLARVWAYCKFHRADMRNAIPTRQGQEFLDYLLATRPADANKDNADLMKYILWITLAALPFFYAARYYLYGWDSTYPYMISGAAVLFLYFLIYLYFATGILPSIVKERMTPRGSGEHGDAGFATIAEYLKGGLYQVETQGIQASIYLQLFVEALTPNGIYQFGRGETVTDDAIFYAGENHILTIAPTGSGKGRCAILPTLLTNGESVVALDIKGELFQLTAEHRRRKLGQKIIRVNPFKMHGVGTERFNPLAFLSASDPSLTAAVKDLSTALVAEETDGRNKFFSDRGRTLLAGIMAYEVWRNEQLGTKATLPDVSAVLGFDDVSLVAYLNKAADTCPLPIVSETLRPFTKANDTIESIKNSAASGLDFLTDPAIRDFLSGHDFNLSDLRTAPTTLYLMMPLNMLQTYPYFVRLMVQAVFTALQNMPEVSHNRRVLMILDEVAQLGYMKVIHNSFSIMRGYGVRLWAIFQSLPDMRDKYGKGADSMLSNAEITQFFTPADMETAKYISDRIGDSTIETKSTSKSSRAGTAGNVGASEGESTAKKAQRFMSPQKILGMPNDRGILFKRELSYPILTTRYHFDDERLGFKKKGWW